MSVAPYQLYRVAPHPGDAHEPKRFRCQHHIRISVKIPQDIHLALAAGTRALAPQLLQSDEILSSIVPFDRQFFADCLYIHRLHCASIRVDDSGFNLSASRIGMHPVAWHLIAPLKRTTTAYLVSPNFDS